MMGLALIGLFSAAPASTSEPDVPEVSSFELPTSSTPAENTRAHLDLNAKCSRQNCDIADPTSSTGRTPKLKPESGGTNDFKLIGKYSSDTLQAAQNLPPVPEQLNGFSGALMDAAHGIGNWIPGFGPTEKGHVLGEMHREHCHFRKGNHRDRIAWNHRRTSVEQRATERL